QDALTVYKTVDPVTGEDLPPHTEGELASKGPTNMLGFFNKPDETAAAIQDGWIRSGDLGRVREDGYLEITGRSKELYKTGGDAGCVCIVRAPGESITADEVITLCKEKLARFKVPKYVLFLDSAQLPTTPTGKVQKFRLVKWAQEQLAATKDN